MEIAIENTIRNCLSLGQFPSYRGDLAHITFKKKFFVAKKYMLHVHTYVLQKLQLYFLFFEI